MFARLQREKAEGSSVVVSSGSGLVPCVAYSLLFVFRGEEITKQGNKMASAKFTIPRYVRGGAWELRDEISVWISR